MNKNSTTQVKDLFLILITFAIILSGINVITEKYFFDVHAQKEAMQNALKRVKDKEKLVNNFLIQSTHTIKSLRETNIFNSYLEGEYKKEDIENIFLAYSKSNPYFMQLRYIDKNGFEKIRIDRDIIQNPYIVEEKQLQNKRNRYYFKDSINKPLEQVWFSALDLNMEKGKVEIPHKPTLRAMYPIKHQDKFNGILIINYLMDDFLIHLADTPLYDTIIFNDAGFPLIHFDDTKSWGNYKDQKYNISAEFLKDHQDILNNNIYQKDTFISNKFDTPIMGGLNIILKIKQSYIEKQRARTNIQYIVITLISLLSAVILTFLIIKFFSKALLNVDVINRLHKDLETASKIAKIGFWEYDAKTKLIYFNSGSYKIYEIPENEKNMHFEKFLSYIHTEDRTQAQKKFKKSIQAHTEFHNIHRIITPNNDIKYVEEKAIHIYDTYGEFVKSLGSIHDVTKLKEQEKQLHRAEKMASMGEMIENIAHQWRQPLSVISTVSTSYKMKQELNVPIDLNNLTEDLERINENAQYLSRTIDDFRNFIKGTSELKTFDLKDDTKQFLHLIESSVKNHNIQVILDEIEDSPKVKGYPNELIQCFINIFNNSKDALKENNNDEERFVFINEKIENDTVIIRFRDNAGGIPNKILSKIFEPYFTTKHQAQGTGIGLHMTYNLIVQIMNGSIEAKNVEYEFNGKNYKGAEFTIMIPIEVGE